MLHCSFVTTLASRGSGVENKRVTGKTFIRFRGWKALKDRVDFPSADSTQKQAL